MYMFGIMQRQCLVSYKVGIQILFIVLFEVIELILMDIYIYVLLMQVFVVQLVFGCGFVVFVVFFYFYLYEVMYGFDWVGVVMVSLGIIGNVYIILEKGFKRIFYYFFVYFVNFK